MVVLCKAGNETPGSIDCGQFIDRLRDRSFQAVISPASTLALTATSNVNTGPEWHRSVKWLVAAYTSKVILHMARYFALSHCCT